MKQIYLLLSCMLLLLCACEFEPSGSHFEEINPTPTNNINIDLNKAADTIYAKGPITYNLYLQLPGKQLRSYQVLMDGTVIKQGQNTSDVIYIDTKKYPDGVHELKVLVESNTGTKSMADKAGHEYMQVYRTWTLVLDNAHPTPVQITRLVAEDGTIKLEWNKYERRYIRNYIVSRKHPMGGGSAYSVTLPPDSTSWQDPYFIGGTAQYTVTVVDTYGLTAESEAVPITVAVPQLLGYEYINKNDLQLTFSACKLYRNFGKYRVSSNVYPDMVYESSKVSDTIVTMPNVGFGVDFALSVSTMAKPEENRGWGANFQFLAEGYGKENKLNGFNVTHHVPQQNLYYDLSNTTIKVIDAQTLQVKHERVSSQYNPRTLSTNGQHLYLYENFGQILKLNPSTLETAATYKLNELLPGISYNDVHIQVSNNNKLLVTTRNYYAGDTLYVVDMNTRRLEFKHGQYSYSWDWPGSTISPDGKMVTSYNFVFRQRADGSWKKEQVPPSSYGTIRYHPSEPLYFLNGRTPITIYSTEDDAVVHSFTLGDNVYPVTIDPATGYLVASSHPYMYIYDIASKKVLKELKLASGHRGVSFFKDKVFTFGYYLPLTL